MMIGLPDLELTHTARRGKYWDPGVGRTETTVSTLLSSSPGTHADPQSDAGSTYTPPLPLLASPETPWSCEDWWQGHAPFDHKTAHFTVCQAPGQTAEHQFFIKQLQRNVLKAGSKTTSVPVVIMKPADVKPPAPALTTLLTHETIETIVLWSGSSNLSRRRLVLLVDSQRWFLYPLFP
ncbi:hypothetical protein G5714_012854 [Onychostoma macrolepis]|uniref:Uncharacterized protein n=1 Tax=Onychostoma macrolepis TaxID=369639 RepID=A0A7J6CIB0_9TELE|nr:hypothetical protein G5714_012854 [Onychostoma macrolepis]